MVLANSHRVSRARQYLGNVNGDETISPTGLSPAMAGFSKPFGYCSPIRPPIQVRHDVPTTPCMQRPVLTHARFGLLPFRSPLLRQSLFVFFSREYLDVSVPPVPPAHLCVRYAVIRASPDRSLATAPRSLSQLTHALHRLLAPRHPPYALSNLIATLAPSPTGDGGHAAVAKE